MPDPPTVVPCDVLYVEIILYTVVDDDVRFCVVSEDVCCVRPAAVREQPLRLSQSALALTVSLSGIAHPLNHTLLISIRYDAPRAFSF